MKLLRAITVAAALAAAVATVRDLTTVSVVTTLCAITGVLSRSPVGVSSRQAFTVDGDVDSLVLSTGGASFSRGRTIVCLTVTGR